jgi:hypothetical protein
MLTRRTFLQGCTSLAASAMVCARAGAVNGEPIRTIQNRIDRLCRRALNERDARAAIVVGVVTPDSGSSGQLLFAGRDTLVNPFGDKLVLDARTPFAIGSTSKVFTSGIHYMLHGPVALTSLASRPVKARLPTLKVNSQVRRVISILPVRQTTESAVTKIFILA